MATAKQRSAAKRNIKKAQRAWKSMTTRQRAIAQPQGRARKKPGTGGAGKYFHITVRPKGSFKSFRTQDVGKPGGIQRVAGHTKSGAWHTQKWLVDKSMARESGRGLIAVHPDAKALFAKLGSAPKHVKGDVYSARPTPNVPERAKPTPAMRRAQTANIKKAQAARRKAARQNPRHPKKPSVFDASWLFG